MTIDELAAQQEIRDVLIRYTRGVDRMDRELVLSCYWPGAHDDHGAFQGTAEEFVEWLEVLRHYDSTMHFVGNQLIEHCRAHIAHYKCPTSVEIRAELARTATGKLQKFKLREPYWKGRDRQVS